MTVVDLMQCINLKQIPHFLVLFGEEYAVMNIYVEKILECGFEVSNPVSVAAAVQQASKRSLVSKNTCYIISEDADFIKDGKWDQVRDTFNTSSSICVLKYNKIDKRSKFYKAIKDNAVEFEKLSNEVLLKYIGEDVEEDIALELIHICDNNYGRILLELDKVDHYSAAMGISRDEALDELLYEGVIHQDIGDITFSLTDAVLMGDLRKANKYLYQAKVKEEPVIMVLSILYDNFKNMLIIQGLGNEKPTEENTGLSNKLIWAVKKKCGGYSCSELLRAMKVIRETEVGIKLGTVDNEIALEYAVLNIMK